MNSLLRNKKGDRKLTSGLFCFGSVVLGMVVVAIGGLMAPVSSLLVTIGLLWAGVSLVCLFIFDKILVDTEKSISSLKRGYLKSKYPNSFE